MKNGAANPHDQSIQSQYLQTGYFSLAGDIVLIVLKLDSQHRTGKQRKVCSLLPVAANTAARRHTTAVLNVVVSCR
jgi:hypothetical protein